MHATKSTNPYNKFDKSPIRAKKMLIPEEHKTDDSQYHTETDMTPMVTQRKTEIISKYLFKN